MEPAAPGTEDEIPLMLSNFKKKEQEQERLLSLKARLSNGKVGNIFEHSIVNGSDQWFCNICACPVIGRMYHHEIGKRHTTSIQNCGGLTEVQVEANPRPSILIAPGEPIPPGFENELEKVAQVQERLDNFHVEPLIGLEYLLELTEYDMDKEPSLLCILCNKKGDPRTVIAHLASYNHISKYLQRHFPKCYNALCPFITSQFKRNWHITMQKIAEAIETRYGRLKPHVIEKEAFEKNVQNYTDMVRKGPHFHERPGATFEELVVKEELTKINEDEISVKKVEDAVKRSYPKTGVTATGNKKRSPSPPVVATPKKPKTSASIEKRQSFSSVSSSDLSDFDPEQETSKVARDSNRSSNTDKSSSKRSYTNSSQDSKRNEFRNKSYRSSRSKSRSQERYEKSHSLLPWKRSDYRSRKDQVSNSSKSIVNKHAEFKKLAAAIDKDMERIFKQHEKHPEVHPQYNDEWKKFWNQRYKELQAEGKNPAGYDFKPEWIEYWYKRLKEMHSSELKTKKDALRKRLGIMDEPAPICFKITGKKKPGQKDEPKESTKPTSMASRPDQDPDVIIIEDEDGTIDKDRKRSHSPLGVDTDRSPYQSRKSRSKSRDCKKSKADISSGTRTRSRERELEYRKSYHDYSRDRYYREYPHEYIKPPKVMRDVTRHPVNTSLIDFHREPEPEDDGEVNIVSVLRLLTALEEKLGSLGPKVIDLLSQALAMEKNEANSSETLLDNDMNCVMFETVKEKLKGQLLAGLVSHIQEKAFKTAIKKIASVIFAAGERKKEKEKNKPKIDPIKVPGIGAVDKAAIAKQIAAALITQGKTDVTQTELEQLINAVVGMAEASQSSGKPITTASFLQKFSQQKEPEPVKQAEPTMAALKNVLQPSVECDSFIPKSNSMEGLSDSDLQTLLQNFKDLCTDEQHSLISYLKKLEAREPERVERLRKFVNLEVSTPTTEKDKDTLFEKSDDETNGKVSPFAGRVAGANPANEYSFKNRNELSQPKIIEKVTIDSDDEDYTFEDVFQAANKNIREQEEREEQNRIAKAATVFKNQNFDVSDAKSLIANLMGQFRDNLHSEITTTNSLKSVVPPPKPPTFPMPPHFPSSNVLDSIPINIANITSALNAAQQIKQNMALPSNTIQNFSSASVPNFNSLNSSTNSLNNYFLQSQHNLPYLSKLPFSDSAAIPSLTGGSSFEPINPRFQPHNSYIEPNNPRSEYHTPHFESPAHLLDRINPPHNDFRKGIQPDRFGRPPEYFDKQW